MLVKSLIETPMLKKKSFPAELLGFATIIGEGNTIDDIADFFEYEISFDVDLAAALRLNALNLSVKIYRSKPDPLSGIRASTTRDSFGQEALLIASAEQTASTVIASKEVSLGLHIPPNYSAVSRTSTDIDAASAFEAKDRLLSNSIRSTATKARTVTPFDNITTISSKKREPYINYRSGVESLSPTIKPENLRNIIPTSNDLNALGPQVSTVSVSNKVVANQVDPGSLSIRNRIEKVISNPELANRVTDMVYLPPVAVPKSATYSFFQKYKTVKVKLSIRKDILQGLSTFFVAARLNDPNGVKRSSVGFYVSHSKRLRDFLTPTLPPSLNTSRSTRYTRVAVTQLDDVGKRIKVFRRKAPPAAGGSGYGTKWEVIFDAPLNKGESLVYRDEIISNKSLIYRAISYGENGDPSDDFSHSIVPPSTLSLAPVADALTANASYDGDYFDGVINVIVADIPTDDIVAIKVRRYDLTYNSFANARSGKGPGYVYIGDNNAKTVNVYPGTTEVMFTDSSAKQARTYRYVPIGVSRIKGPVRGTPYIIDIPMHDTANPVSFTMSSPASSIGGPPGDVEFSLDGKFTDIGFKKIKDALTVDGQSQLFSDEFDKNREKFSGLVNFLVDRENLTTGEVETFGVVESGKFVDNDLSRQASGVSAPEPGTRYVYAATALINTADSLFPNVVKSKIDPTTLTRFNENISKLANPITRQTGVIPSTHKQNNPFLASKLFPSDPILAGRTAIQAKKTFSLIAPSNSPKEISYEKNKMYNLVSWVYDGDLTMIDHFKICVKAGGGSVVIDTIHCDASSSRFFYKDRNIVSSMKYRYEIIAVNLFYEEISSLESKPIDPQLLTALGSINAKSMFSDTSIITAIRDK